ncbi:RidA family protein [Yinghuangia sp. YIM S09857]|uniref:RidA family protein n=1 Tax=Yinghuangia sp. YIM S09857 TaxID=3436929 RepID=UPI003F52F91D
MTSPQLTHITEPEGVAPGTGYTHVVVGSGRLAVISGQVAYDENGKLVGRGDPEAQTRQVFENLRRCLAAVGATFDHVVKFTHFVTDFEHIGIVRTVRDEHVNTHRPPASSAVQVVRLFDPELIVEIEALVLLPDDAERVR